MRKKRIILILFVLSILLAFVLFWQVFSRRSVEYQDAVSGISFDYPNPWGAPVESPGNDVCPEEDTYRTPDTLSIFDRELKFPDRDLADTESFLRIGIKFYEMDPDVSNECNDDVLRVLAKREMAGEEFSSVRLTTADIPGFYGVVNENASRLDTEYRSQYTLFRPEANGKILVIQPYLSFIPYYDSLEWKEIEAKWKKNVLGFILEGESSKEERNILEDFYSMAESLNI